MCLPEKKATKLTGGVQQDTFSGPVSRQESQNSGVFERFSAKQSLVSLQPRLNGGEGGIRTLGTGVSPYNGLANESFPPPLLVFNHLPSCGSVSVGLGGPHAAVIVLHFVLLPLTIVFSCQIWEGL
jgi:hypothetical protein